MGAGRQKAALSNLPAPRVARNDWGVPRDGDASAVPGTRSPEKNPAAVFCRAGSTPNPFNPPSSWCSAFLVLGWGNRSVLGIPKPPPMPFPLLRDTRGWLTKAARASVNE